MTGEGGKERLTSQFSEFLGDGMMPQTEFCAPPTPIHMLKPNPQSEGARRWGLWEELRSGGWSLHGGISTL